MSLVVPLKRYNGDISQEHFLLDASALGFVVLKCDSTLIVLVLVELSAGNIFEGSPSGKALTLTPIITERNSSSDTFLSLK